MPSEMRNDNETRSLTDSRVCGQSASRLPVCSTILTVLSVLIVAGCATTANRAEPTSTDVLVRRFVLDHAHVPPPPAGLSPAVGEAWAALRSGDSAAADQVLALADPASRDSAGGHVARGYLLLARGATAESRTHFQEALTTAPGYAVALYGLGFLSEALGNRVAGLDWYQRALEADPGLSAAAVRKQVLELEQAQALIVEGELAEARGDVAAALVAYQSASRLGPDVLEPYLRIADIQRRSGGLEDAVLALQAARDRIGDVRVVLEPLGQTLQQSGSYEEAYFVFQALEAIAPEDPEVRDLVLAARELYFTTSLPEPYQRLEEKAQIVREDLAALIAIRMPDLGDSVSDPRTGVIMTDVDDSWAEPYIRDVVAWTVMEPFQNHAFLPGLEVKRQMFAEVAFRVLGLLGATENAPRARLGDVSSDHYFYDQIRVVVGYGILPLGPRDSFGLLDTVSGEEAIAAMQRLVRIARGSDD